MPCQYKGYVFLRVFFMHLGRIEILFEPGLQYRPESRQRRAFGRRLHDGFILALVLAPAFAGFAADMTEKMQAAPRARGADI